MQKLIEESTLATIYDSILSPAGWEPLLDALPAMFDGAKGCIQLWSRGSDDVLTLPFGTGPDYAASYMRHYGAVNPYPSANVRRLPFFRDKVVFAHDVVPAEIVKRTEFYNDWMAPQGITTEHFAVALNPDPSEAAVLVVAPDVAAGEMFAQFQAKRLLALRPHFVRAVAMRRRLTTALDVQAAFGSGLDAIGTAAFALTPSGHVLHANAGGEAMLARADVLGLAPDGVLAPVNPPDAGALEALIGRARKRGPVVGTPVKLKARFQDISYLAWALDPHAGAEGSARNQLGAIDGLDRPQIVLLLVMPADRGIEVPLEALRAAFRLSPAEARLAAALVGGMTPQDYAAEKNLSRNTLRNQIASVLAKTGTSRQAEMVSRVLAVLGPLAGKQAGE